MVNMAKKKKTSDFTETDGLNSCQPVEKYDNNVAMVNSETGSISAGQDGETGDSEQRETWGKKVDFLLSVIGFAVDLANVWRFPYLCYKNGGGAFLVPYCLMLVMGGIPLFYMELALGQYNRKGAITCWGRICPLFQGVGYAVVLIAFYTDFFYNVIIAWALHYFFTSFTGNLPWTTCNNSWNTPDCYDGHMTPGFFFNKTDNNLFAYGTTHNQSGGAVASHMTQDAAEVTSLVLGTASSAVVNVTEEKRVSPALEYFERGMLGLNESPGIENIGTVRWQLALCLLAVYIICYFSLWKGISTSGKVVWFTALFPYVVLFILLIRGVTLPGAADGIKYYLTPDFSSLHKSEVWVDAATQVFFSLGPGFGVLLAFASYNRFHNNVYADALATSIINCATSFLSGFVIFSVLGYMSFKTGKHISKVATEGPGLVFVVYPEAIATLPGSTFWALLFFLMLLTLGLDSSFGGSEAIITALSDEYPIIKRNREIFVACLFTFYMMIGLASCTQGGAYVVTLMDRYAAGYSILFAVFFESLAVSWFYGVGRFSDDIKQMLGFKPGVYWKLCWKFVAPCFILCIMVFGFVMYEPLRYEAYVYPLWANLLGWAMALSSMLCIPAVALYKICSTPGTLKHRLTILTTPWKETVKANVVVNENKELGNGNQPTDEV